jgi:hypothetical protein
MPQAENNDLQRRTGGFCAVVVAAALPGSEPVRTLDVAGRGPGTPWGHQW